MTGKGFQQIQKILVNSQGASRRARHFRCSSHWWDFTHFVQPQMFFLNKVYFWQLIIEQHSIKIMFRSRRNRCNVHYAGWRSCREQGWVYRNSFFLCLPRLLEQFSSQYRSSENGQNCIIRSSTSCKLWLYHIFPSIKTWLSDEFLVWITAWSKLKRAIYSENFA